MRGERLDLSRVETPELKPHLEDVRAADPAPFRSAAAIRPVMTASPSTGGSRGSTLTA